MLRFRFNHVKASVVYDTWPKMMGLCFPDVPYQLDKSDWFAELPNRSQVWFGGLDEKERTEKVLGQEYVTILLNEISQIPWASRNVAVTRLAQRCAYSVGGVEKFLRLLMLYDCNPPPKSHWSYQVFHLKRDPETRESMKDPHVYASLRMNPVDNLENLPAEYMAELDRLPARLRVRFRDGLYADTTEGALWTIEMIESWRQSEIPDMQRIVIGIDPSGSGDADNAANDEIGIVVAGLGTDGNGYVLEDLSLKAGPQTWGTVATKAFERHDADMVVAETNFGGEMVRFVVHAARPKTPFRKVVASRGKVVRAEPISALTEQGKVRFAGSFPELEDELCGFTTAGYIGTGSPNRADAMIWAMSELFPGIAKRANKQPADNDIPVVSQGAQGWMG